MLSRIFLLVSLYFTFTPSFADKVYWLPNKSIKVADNFKDGELPCSGQVLVFPESVEESVLISGLSISGLVLPTDGVILLEEDGIIFGQDPNDKCTKTTNSYYKDDQIFSWAQPDVWRSSRFNPATPDAERVPCYDDVVVFPENGQFTVKMPEIPQFVENVMHANNNGTDSDFIYTQSNDQTEQFISNGMLIATHLKPGHGTCSSTMNGCPCQDYTLDIECELKYCPPPRCSHPIKPVGHCCEICGASLVIEITNDFHLSEFRKTVHRVVESYGVDNFDYHVGLLPRKYKPPAESLRVQVIVLDKGEYTGECKQVIADINYKIPGEWVKKNYLYFSGKASSQSGGGVIVVSVFFMVVLVMGAMFGYHYKWSMSNLRDLRGGVPRGMLSHLYQRTESVMSLTSRRGSTVSTATTEGTFRNPLYSSMRERVQVSAAINEE